MTLLEKATFADLPEFGVGHASNFEGMTGCTCFVARGDCASGVVCGVDVRGGAPATRETDLLKPENMVQAVNAVMISGGSAFGLEAACGAMKELAHRKMGFELAGAYVPIVPAACLFDLPVGMPIWPDESMGAAACRSALEYDSKTCDGDIAQGSVGAGTGATVGKMGLPEQVMKSGFGWAGVRLGDLVVIACTAVNALGNIIAEDGSWLAGVKDANGNVMDPLEAAAAAMAANPASNEAKADAGADANTNASANAGLCENTTLGVVLTNAILTKAEATKVAQMAQDAYARAIRPVHTLNDGDTIFVMASGRAKALPNTVGILANEAMEQAIRSGVASAMTNAMTA